MKTLVVKTLITALAVTAILTTSVVAQTARNRNKEVRVQHNNLLSRNAVSHSSANLIKASHCHFHHGEADPDPQVRLMMMRDCKEHEQGDEH